MRLETEKHFNRLNPAQAERIAMLMEEAGEIVQACGKVLRHGYESHNPNDAQSSSNRHHLHKEIRDIEAIIEMMRSAHDLSGVQPATVTETIRKKMRYTHHQEAALASLTEASE